MSEIERKYEALGGAGVLGGALEPERVLPDGVGRMRPYQGGHVYWHPATGAFVVCGAIFAKWAELGWEAGVLGYPTTDETAPPDGVGRFSHFQHGSVYWHPGIGAFVLLGGIRIKWADLGWERGFLGYPTSDERTAPDGYGRFSTFQGGAIYWTPHTGAFEVHGAILEKWRALGGESSFLGYPISDERTPADGVGRYSVFEGGRVDWHPAIGAFEMHGAILALWIALGEEQSPLGYPTSDETTAADGVGRFSLFQTGAVWWHPEIGAHAILEPIHARWRAAGGEAGDLGYPIAGDAPAPDGVGRFARFQGGDIAWHPVYGACVISGAFVARWHELGGIAGPGYPTADVAAVGAGAVATFERGALYGHPDTGVHLVREPFRAAWLAQGGPAGALGWPTSDERVSPEAGLHWADFQQGCVVLRDDEPQVVVEAVPASLPELGREALERLIADGQTDTSGLAWRSLGSWYEPRGALVRFWAGSELTVALPRPTDSARASLVPVFGGPPTAILRVEGRGYPMEVRWNGPTDERLMCRLPFTAADTRLPGRIYSAMQGGPGDPIRLELAYLHVCRVEGVERHFPGLAVVDLARPERAHPEVYPTRTDAWQAFEQGGTRPAVWFKATDDTGTFAVLPTAFRLGFRPDLGLLPVNPRLYLRDPHEDPPRDEDYRVRVKMPIVPWLPPDDREALREHLRRTTNHAYVRLVSAVGLSATFQLQTDFPGEAEPAPATAQPVDLGSGLILDWDRPASFYSVLSALLSADTAQGVLGTVQVTLPGNTTVTIPARLNLATMISNVVEATVLSPTRVRLRNLGKLPVSLRATTTWLVRRPQPTLAPTGVARGTIEPLDLAAEQAIEVDVRPATPGEYHGAEVCIDDVRLDAALKTWLDGVDRDVSTARAQFRVTVEVVDLGGAAYRGSTLYAVQIRLRSKGAPAGEADLRPGATRPSAAFTVYRTLAEYRERDQQDFRFDVELQSFYEGFEGLPQRLPFTGLNALKYLPGLETPDSRYTLRSIRVDADGDATETVVGEGLTRAETARRIAELRDQDRLWSLRVT